MTLSEYLRTQHIPLYAALDADTLPVRMPRLLPPAQEAVSAVVMALPYYVEDVEGNVAQFARGRDYHGYAARLTEGCRAILKERYPAAAVHGFADHSPYDEVRSAAMAGLGVIGDNGLLLTAPYGGYVFLFTLITSILTAEWLTEGIPAGTGEIGYCDHCGACRQACPGQCIGGGRDTCLSAITQKKGALTPAEAAAIRQSAYVWGCDVCLRICPYGEHRETEIAYFRESRLPRLRTDWVKDMEEAAYKERAYGWRKKDVLLRNLQLMEDEV